MAIKKERSLRFYCLNNNKEYLLDQWDYLKNAPLTPDDVTKGSDKKYWWICNRGHSFLQGIGCRTNQGQGCYYCAGKRVLPGFNDLATIHPELIDEWSENNSIRPTEVTCYSQKEVEWCCLKCGYTWNARINNRAINGSGCPACAGSVLIKGINDLASQYPLIANEWDYSKNENKPDEYFAHSHTKVNWLCPACQFSYPMRIQNRTSQRQGCPKCAKRWQTSFPEQAIYYYIHKVFPDAEQNIKKIIDGNYELDIYIPSEKMAIEYDGPKHENKIDEDRTKYTECKKKHIRLIRVREERLPASDGIADVTIVSHYNQNKSLSEVSDFLYVLFEKIGINIAVDLTKDERLILEAYYSELKNKSALSLHPELECEWDQESNGIITLAMLSPSDKHKFMWKCSQCGNRWSASVNSRTQGKGCRECGKRLAKAYLKVQP